MHTKTLLKIGLLAILLIQSLSAKLDVATLNCYFFFSPANAEKTGMKRAPMAAADYAVKTENLAKLITESGAEMVGLQEIGSKIEAQDLADVLSKTTGSRWAVLFAQGNDTYTGQDVAVVYRQRAGLRVVGSSRDGALSALSKHLVAKVEADGKTYDICVVHLIRPIGSDGAQKHARQLDALRDWARARTGTVIVMGDFNDPTHDLLSPLEAANRLVSWQSTHISNKSFDHLYASGGFKSANIVRPPYGPRPNDYLKTVWTDHFLVAASAP